MNASGRINDFDYEPGGCGTQALVYGIIVAIVMFFSGCKSIQYVPVVETQYKHDSIYFTNVQFDSIYVHDSISYKEKGDTIIMEKWHTKYKEKQVHDTLYQEKVDSVRIPVPYEVEKKLTSFQQMKMDYGGWAIGIVLISFIYVLYKVIRKFLPRGTI